jgi:hypothetical protein
MAPSFSPSAMAAEVEVAEAVAAAEVVPVAAAAEVEVLRPKGAVEAAAPEQVVVDPVVAADLVSKVAPGVVVPWMVVAAVNFAVLKDGAEATMQHEHIAAGTVE